MHFIRLISLIYISLQFRCNFGNDEWKKKCANFLFFIQFIYKQSENEMWFTSIHNPTACQWILLLFLHFFCCSWCIFRSTSPSQSEKNKLYEFLYGYIIQGMHHCSKSIDFHSKRIESATEKYEIGKIECMMSSRVANVREKANRNQYIIESVLLTYCNCFLIETLWTQPNTVCVYVH